MIHIVQPHLLVGCTLNTPRVWFKLESAMANRGELMKALEAVISEYAEGRGPLVKFAEQNAKLIEMATQNSNLFRYLGVPDHAWQKTAC